MYVESEDLVKKDDRGSEGKRVIKTKQRVFLSFFSEYSVYPLMLSSKQ
jgi:hypothetical protein